MIGSGVIGLRAGAGKCDGGMVTRRVSVPAKLLPGKNHMMSDHMTEREANLFDVLAEPWTQPGWHVEGGTSSSIHGSSSELSFSPSNSIPTDLSLVDAPDSGGREGEWRQLR